MPNTLEVPTFGSNTKSTPKIDDFTKDLTRLSKSTLDLSASKTSQGSQAIDPALKYLTGLLSGDRNRIAEASAPEAATILAQYDTARRSVAEQMPRGGAKGEKIAESYFQQAGDMTKLLETQRPQAAQILSSLGLDLEKLGLSEEELAQSGLVEVLQALVQKRGQNQSLWGDIGKGIGSVISALL